MAAGDITKALVTRVKYSIGEDAEPGHFSQGQVIDWLDEAQRKLVTLGPILLTVGIASSKDGVEFYTLPPDFFAMHRVEYRPATGTAVEIPSGNLFRKGPGKTPGIPKCYGIWGANNSLGANAQVIWFDQQFVGNGTDDIWIFFQQFPAVLSTSVDPEVRRDWWDYMVSYAEMRARGRLMAFDPAHRSLLDLAAGIWKEGMEKARGSFVDLSTAKPLPPVDTAGYTY